MVYFGGRRPLSASPNTKIRNILKLMIKEDKRVVILTGKKDARVRGIVVCGDICRLLYLKNKYRMPTNGFDYYTEFYERPISTIMTHSFIKAHYDLPLFRGLHVMQERNIGTLPLIDRDGGLKGNITERDIAFLLAETNRDIKVRDLMSYNVTTCSPHYTIQDALNITCESGFRRLPVVKKDELVGYLTVKDLLSHFSREKIIKLIKNGKIDVVFDERITAIMITSIITIHPDASITEFAQTLKKHNFGALPVVEDEKLVGIITERDIVNVISIYNEKIKYPKTVQSFQKSPKGEWRKNF
ncbi:MAG: CBS domain-containing protein [Promethearchaeota archaeon]